MSAPAPTPAEPEALVTRLPFGPEVMDQPSVVGGAVLADDPGQPGTRGGGQRRPPPGIVGPSDRAEAVQVFGLGLHAWEIGDGPQLSPK